MHLYLYFLEESKIVVFLGRRNFGVSDMVASREMRNLLFFGFIALLFILAYLIDTKT